MKYIKTYEKLGDDYSNWKTYQLFDYLYDRGRGKYRHICITMKYEKSIRKIYEFDTCDDNENKNKIVPVKAFYFSPDLNNPDIIYQSDNFDEIYEKFEAIVSQYKYNL
jgi:hypothetical protein